MNERVLGPREVSRLTGVSTDTLRHYERLRLLPLPVRTQAGYRRYTQAAVDRVLLIQRALVVGFSLRDLSRVLGERDKGGAPCREVRAIVGDRLQQLEQRIQDLLLLRKDLKTLLEEWDARLAGTPPGQRAHLLDTLGAHAPIEHARREKGKGIRK